MKRGFHSKDGVEPYETAADETTAYAAYEDSEEDEDRPFVKIQRLMPEEFEAALGGDGMQEVFDLVDEVVAEQFVSLFAGSSADSQGYSTLFYGMESADISKGLYDGEPFAFGSPDMVSDDSPYSFEEEPFGRQTPDEELTAEDFVLQEDDSEDDGEELTAEDFMLQEDEVEDPEAYARQIAEELCDEILNEIVAEELSGWWDATEQAEVLAMTELAPTRDMIRTAVYQAVWEQWAEDSDPSDD